MSDAPPTREAALAELRRMAAAVHERTEVEATARLLEHVTAADDPERLRAALAEIGAKAMLPEAGTRDLGLGCRP